MGKIYRYNQFFEFVVDQIEICGRGTKLKLAKHLRCQTGYLSRLLNGQRLFTLEQGEEICSFFEVEKKRKIYLLLLLQKNRSSTSSLKKVLEEQLSALKNESRKLSSRVDAGFLMDQKISTVYYSSWIYSAVHIFVGIGKGHSASYVSKYFNRSVSEISKILNFLFESNLIFKSENLSYSSSNQQVHLSSDSHLIANHHKNWRLKAIENIEKNNEDSLHYSSVVSLSNEDFETIREILLGSIQKSKKIISDSKEEVLGSFCMDFFKL